MDWNSAAKQKWNDTRRKNDFGQNKRKKRCEWKRPQQNRWHINWILSVIEIIFGGLSAQIHTSHSLSRINVVKHRIWHTISAHKSWIRKYWDWTMLTGTSTSYKILYSDIIDVNLLILWECAIQTWTFGLNRFSHINFNGKKHESR